jgi:hypothetical protein
MQQADCEIYAKKQQEQMRIDHRFVEVKSGRTLDRDELNALLELIRSQSIVELRIPAYNSHDLTDASALGYLLAL